MENLDLQSGIPLSLDPKSWKDFQGIIFVGSQYCPAFFDCWKKALETHTKIKIEFFDPKDSELANLSNTSWLEVSKPKSLWLGQIQDSKAITSLGTQKFSAFCSAQNFKSFQDKFENILTVNLGKIISPNLAAQLLQMLGFKLSTPRLEVIKNWVKQSLNNPNLDQLVNLARQLELTGQKDLKALDQYNHGILESEKKFFLLPGLFFSGQHKDFLKLWQTVEQDFPLQFWVAFWTNAFFKACCYKSGNCKNTFCKTFHRISSMPFFKKLSLQDLQEGCYELAKIDYKSKQSANQPKLESLFLKFF